MKKNKKKEDIDLKKEYAKSWKYIKETKIYFLIIVLLFIIMAVIGFLVPAPEIISTKIMEILEEILLKTQGMNTLELIFFIITNNVQTSFLGMIFGFILGIFPLITIIVNGYLLGFVSSMAVGVESGFSLLKLLPHGIFEIPAIVLSLGIGLKLGTFPFKKNPRKTLKKYLTNSIRVFFLVVLPLLVLAGIIEGSLIFLLN
jgi:stage II sporulation protein M